MGLKVDIGQHSDTLVTDTFSACQVILELPFTLIITHRTPTNILLIICIRGILARQ